MKYYQFSTRAVMVSGIWVLVFAGLYMTSLYSYLLFHNLSELFSIVVSFSIFLFAWNTRNMVDDDYLIILGIAYLYVGVFDLVHMLSYEGMGILTVEESYHATQMWVIARYMESLSLLAIPLFFRRRVNTAGVLAFYSVISVVLFTSAFLDWFPACYVQGVGLTPFKVISEYVICAILLSAGIQLYRHRSSVSPKVLGLLMASIGFTIISELMFTLYISVYGPANMLGHMLKIISTYLVYKAIVGTGLIQPYKTIFRKLNESNEALEDYSTKLEVRVQERTRDLEESNRKLAMLSRKLISAQEEERNRIARDLHDGISQTLGAMKFHLEILVEKLGEQVSNEDRSALENLVPMTQSAIEEVRLVIRNLKPSKLEDLGIIGAINIMSREFEERHGNVRIRRDLQLNEQQVPESIKTPLYRILQETLNNIGKHSNARNVNICLVRKNGQICLDVTDDGDGFDTEVVKKLKPLNSGYGLGGMEERAEISGAEFSIDSRPGVGTCIEVVWPLMWDN